MASTINIPLISTGQIGALAIKDFRRMDSLAIEKFHLPIELMMENAGLHLAQLVVRHAKKSDTILIGVGTGNNGGGGLVAARRLAAWGYSVNLHIPQEPLRSLPSVQLKRALAFGVNSVSVSDPDIFIDAYMGFSQRSPLSEKYAKAIALAKSQNALKISLDIPTGFDRDSGQFIFEPDLILNLVAPKKELISAQSNAEIYLADIGFPAALYKDFGLIQPDFSISGILKIT